MKSFADKVVEAVDNGSINPLDLDVQMKRIEELAKIIRKSTKEQVIEEAEKHGKKFDYNGAEVSLTERRTLDYSNDDTWTNLKERIKQREDLLKGLKMSLVDEETGEVLNPPLVKVSDVLSYKLK